MPLPKKIAVINSNNCFFEDPEKAFDLDPKWMKYISSQFSNSLSYSERMQSEDKVINSELFFCKHLCKKIYEGEIPTDIPPEILIDVMAEYLINTEGCEGLIVLAFPHDLKDASVPDYKSDYFQNSHKLRISDVAGSFVEAFKAHSINEDAFYVWSLGDLSIKRIFFPEEPLSKDIDPDEQPYVPSDLLVVDAKVEVQIMTNEETQSLYGAFPKYYRQWNKSQEKASELMDNLFKN